MTLNGVFAVVNKATAKVICDAGPIIHLEELMTTYERLIQQGEAIGIQKGEAIGIQKVLQRLLRKRFPLDAEQLIPLLSHLSQSQQEELTERILDVADAHEIRRWIQSLPPGN